MSRAVAIDLDGALGDTHALWAAFLTDAARRFRSIAELDVGTLPSDRAEAARPSIAGRARVSGTGDPRSHASPRITRPCT